MGKLSPNDTPNELEGSRRLEGSRLDKAVEIYKSDIYDTVKPSSQDYSSEKIEAVQSETSQRLSENLSGS